MSTSSLIVHQSSPLHGRAGLYGAKNAALPIMASLILTDGKSILLNVPGSRDVYTMMDVLKGLGVETTFDEKQHVLTAQTSKLDGWEVSAEVMGKMRASILVMGALLARFGKARVALPGGCEIGSRPVNLHLSSFEKLGVEVEEKGGYIEASYACSSHMNRTHRLVLEYPSVGATENLLMFAALGALEITIVNAALEPEVLDLIAVLRGMGAHITISSPLTILVRGVNYLRPIVHEIAVDRLEAGTLLLAAAITKGDITITNARAHDLDAFLEKLREMGHEVRVGSSGVGIEFFSHPDPKAVGFKTGPYPSFPTDLQAPMMAVQTLASGTCHIDETVFESRLGHIEQLRKMGADISMRGGVVQVLGVPKLTGTRVAGCNIRSSAALVIAGLAATGTTEVEGGLHWDRGYDHLEVKLAALGARISRKGDGTLLTSNKTASVVEV